MQSNGIKTNLLHAAMITQYQYSEFNIDNLLNSLFIFFIKSKKQTFLDKIKNI